MIKSRIAIAAALFAVGGAANAGITVTPTLTTDYDFRGLTQTDEAEAFQLSVNLNTEGGFYVGAWGSNVDIPGGDQVWELDLMAGFAGGDAAEGIGYDVGAIMYAYPSSSDSKDIYEIYGGISHGWFSGKVWIAPDNYSQWSMYTEANAAIPLPHDFVLGLHAGYSSGEYWHNANGGGYLEYSVGVTKSLGQFAFNLKYVNSNDYSDPVVGRNAWIGSVSTTLPWGGE
jgi:uncharacterized protein (TIGR02001 family)